MKQHLNSQSGGPVLVLILSVILICLPSFLRLLCFVQIKSDVETQGDFIRFLIKEVENAAFTKIEDVVPFVKWLDDELSYLVHFRESINLILA